MILARITLKDQNAPPKEESDKEYMVRAHASRKSNKDLKNFLKEVKHGSQIIILNIQTLKSQKLTKPRFIS